MNYKKRFYTLVGAILLYCFYSFVEIQRIESTTVSQSEQIKPTAEPIADSKEQEKAESVKAAAMGKKKSTADRRRENYEGFGKLAESEYEPGKFYYSDGKIVEYKKVIQKVDKLEERNLESEFSKIFNEN